MDSVFNDCVRLLLWIAEKTGTTCKEINVIIFCVVWPAFTLWLILRVRKYRRRIQELESSPPFIRPDKAPDILTELTFVRTEDGGRLGPAFSGYRPDHDFGLDGTLNGGQMEFLDVHEAKPGDTVKAHFWLLAPELNKGRMYKGMKFTSNEGAKIIAHGVILEVINSDLIEAV